MKRMPVIIAVIISSIFIGFIGFCILPQALAQPGEEPASAFRKFGFKLFAQLTGEKGQNVFISPAGAAFALAMAYNGAAGETRQAMGRTLEIRDLGLEELNRGNALLRQALSAPDPKIKVNLANSLWLHQGLSFKPEFLKNNAMFYGAAPKVLNLNDPGTPAAINAWVSKETAGKITRLVDKVQPPLVLANAVYFLGTWTRPFNKTLTRETPFTKTSGQQKQVQMMVQSGTYQYFQGPNFQAVHLPYGAKSRFGMKVFLPGANSNLQEFLREINPAHWQKWLAAMEPMPGTVMLPRFKATYRASLKAPLQALGMAPAFDRRSADFSNLCPPPGAYIDDVIHQALVEVNEEGTEAAAATAVVMETTALRTTPPKSFTMIVDRPFSVAIDDRETGALLFLGAIFDPE